MKINPAMIGPALMSVMLESGLNIRLVATRRFHSTGFEHGFAAMLGGQSGKVILDRR